MESLNYNKITNDRNYKTCKETNMKKVKLAELDTGERIQFGGINGEPLVWRIAEQNHKGFPKDTVTIITDRTIGNITFAPANPLDKNHDRRLYGSSRYKDSYVRHFVNSEEFIKAVFTEEEAKAIIETEVKIRQPYVDGSDVDTIVDRLFLLSTSEVGHKEEDEEGNIFELFKDGENRRVLDINGSYDWWWLRSAVVSYSYFVRIVSANGSTNGINAYAGHVGVRPACNLLSGNLVSKA
jgi:hypothetical protein